MTISTDSGKAASDLSAQHNGLQANTDKSKKSLSDYAKGLVEAAEKANPVAKSIGETAEQFKTFREVTGLVGDALGNYKNKVSAALDNSKTFNSGAGAGAKALEVLKTSSEVASGGFEGLGKAITGTGVGLFIVVLASAIEYFKKFTPLVEFCQRTTAALSGAFDALGNMVGKQLQPMMRIFTEPKQAMLDFAKFLLDNVINRFKAVGVIINSIMHPSLKGLADGFIQLQTGVTNATDKMTNLGKALTKAATETANLTGAQQNLDRQIQNSSLKSAEDAARIAELRVKAQTGDLKSRKEALKEIQNIEKAETTEHKKQVEEQVRITVGKVATTHGLTQAEIGDIKTLDAKKIESLRISKNLNAEDVKSLQEAVKQMADLRKEEADKELKQHTDSEAKLQIHEQNKKSIKQKAKAEQQEIADSAERIKLGNITNSREREMTALKDDFDQQIKAQKGHNAVILQLKKELDARLKQLQTEFDQQDLNDKKTLYDMQQEVLIKAAGNNFEKAHNLKVTKTKKDLEFELANINLTETQKLIIKEKYKQKLDELNAEIDNSKAKTDKKTTEKSTQTIKKGAEDEIKIIGEKLKYYQNHFSKLSGMFAKHTEASKAAFMAQKALAVAQIAINTEKQVSDTISATKAAVASDQEFGPIIGPVKAAIDIAIGAAEVVGTIANGVKQVSTINSTNPQGFARGGLYMSDGYGGYITGPGSGTSDSINAKLSNGESIINARSTEMFAPILSAINQAGGGRAFNSVNTGNGYALGGLFNGSNTLNDGYSELANTRALNDMAKTLAANMPRQILVVEDVQASLQNKAMLQSMSNF